MRCRQPQEASRLLAETTGEDQTLYGMLAAEQLGRRLPDRVGRADVSAEDWQTIGRYSNVRAAVALAEIGEDVLASDVLLHQARIGDPADYAALSRLARDLGMPQTQLFMAYNAPAGGLADPASFYPTPRWTPLGGWRVDPALAYAAGDANAGKTPQVVGAAYTYNQRDDKLTTNYAIDRALGALVTQGSVEGVAPVVSPNTGRLFTVGPLGLGPLQDASLDITDVGNHAFLAARTASNGRTRLYRVDLASGRPRLLGTIGDGAALRGLAVAP